MPEADSLSNCNSFQIFTLKPSTCLIENNCNIFRQVIQYFLKIRTALFGRPLKSRKTAVLLPEKATDAQ